MYNYPDLIRAREDMNQQTSLYKPTVFWEEASTQIVAELCQHGVQNFRNLPTALGYFAPTYGIPGGSFSEQQVQELTHFHLRQFPENRKSYLALSQFLRGNMAALSDFRVLTASDNQKKLPYLHYFSESAIGTPVEQFEFNNRRYSRSALNYLLGLSLLKQHLGDFVPRTVLEIGGGFGTLGEILANAQIPDLRYIDIDIPPTSFVAEYYLSKVLGKEHVTTYLQTANKSSIEIAQLTIATVLCSWQIEKLRGEVDLFVNFISFQEMEPHIVQNYLSHVMRLKARWVLLRNMREGKQLRKNGFSGVDTPILGEDYLRMLPDYELVEKNIVPFGYQTVDGYHSELLLLRRKGNEL